MKTLENPYKPVIGERIQWGVPLFALTLDYGYELFYNYGSLDEIKSW